MLLERRSGRTKRLSWRKEKGSFGAESKSQAKKPKGSRSPRAVPTVLGVDCGSGWSEQDGPGHGFGSGTFGSGSGLESCDGDCGALGAGSFDLDWGTVGISPNFPSNFIE